MPVEGQPEGSGTIISSYISGAFSYNFKDNSTVVVHARYQDDSDPDITVLYDYDQSVGTYTGNPEQDGNLVITAEKVAAMVTAGPNPNVIFRSVARDADSTNPVQVKINGAKESGLGYVVITNEEIPLEDVANPTPVTITIADNIFTIGDDTFAKAILPVKRMVASFRSLSAYNYYSMDFYNDNTYVFNINYMYEEDGIVVVYNYDQSVGTYSGDPTKDGEVTFKGGRYTDKEDSSREKIEQAKDAGEKYVTITNEEIPLTGETNRTVTVSISNGTFTMGDGEDEDTFVKVSNGL